MPKKFGINQKSQSAIERKEASKKEAKDEILRRKEDAQWVDDDKHVQKKQQRKDEKEAKQREQEAKKSEKKALREAEEESLQSKASKGKVTHFMIQRELEKTAQRSNFGGIPGYLSPKPDEELIVTDLKEQNRALMSTHEVSATGLDRVTASLDRLDVDSPTQPQRVTYKEFESRKIPALKIRLPGLRLSQYKEMVWSEWKRSPENPTNATS